ncbi:HTH La-type RNA-binding domain-containing protein [Mycena venus]|uniref:HTH La-type RNA-binding domain-containing protein n=1 Tax=Mycena venus TaxID=2733690 RepID=A0A8H6Y0M4_9AGAR|nr:HTH La-type RNA-binding domain-containing protein [Mycena venus]
MQSPSSIPPQAIIQSQSQSQITQSQSQSQTTQSQSRSHQPQPPSAQTQTPSRTQSQSQNASPNKKAAAAPNSSPTAGPNSSPNLSNMQGAPAANAQTGPGPATTPALNNAQAPANRNSDSSTTASAASAPSSKLSSSPPNPSSNTNSNSNLPTPPPTSTLTSTSMTSTAPMSASTALTSAALAPTFIPVASSSVSVPVSASSASVSGSTPSVAASVTTSTSASGSTSISAFPTPAESVSGAMSPTRGGLSGFTSGITSPVRGGGASGAVSPVRSGRESPSVLSASVNKSLASVTVPEEESTREREKVESSGSTSANTSAKEKEASGAKSPVGGKTGKARKWVAIPPEELRAAAEQQLRTVNVNANGSGHRERERDRYPRERERERERDGNGWGGAGGSRGGEYRNGNGNGGRKSQSHSASHSVSQSGTTSRAESVVSGGYDRDRDILQVQPQLQPQHQQTQAAPQPAQDGGEYTAPLSLPQGQGWNYLPPPAQYYPPPPPHFYGVGAPYGAYEGAPPVHAPYGYWAQPGSGIGAEDGKEGAGAGAAGDPYRGNGWVGPGHAGWWPMPQPQPQPQPQQVEGTQEGATQQLQQPQQQDAPREDVSQPQQRQPAREDPPPQPQERPPPPTESGAVSVSSSLSALARGGGGMVFGTVDAGLTDQSPSLSTDLPPSATVAALASSSSASASPPPPPLPASPSREPTWRAAVEPVWPTDPAWDASGSGAGWVGAESILNSNSALINGAGTGTTSASGKPTLLAIGVSPRARAKRLADDPGMEVLDVTVAPGALGGRWEFGTTREAERRTTYYPYGAYAGYGYDTHGQPLYAPYAPPPPMVDGMMPPHVHGQGMMQPLGMGVVPVGPPPQMMGIGGMGMGAYGMPPPPPGQMQGMLGPPNGVPMDGEGVPSNSNVDTGSGPVIGNGNAGGERRGEGSDWEVPQVKDYGYFSGAYGREERNAYLSRASRDLEHAPHQDERPPRDVDYPVGRQRRGSYNGGAYGYEPRGAYGGRRGRGFRGYGRYGRGGFQQQPRAPPTQQQPPPFSITPPPHFTPLVPEGYYPTPYMPTSYDYAQPAHHLAPVPTLRTRLSFPIDRLRQEILSQLEFYLSPDNMATDLYLRQQMDSQGWVRIETLASFKRVQSKTSDVNLVRDVLGLSDYAEIRGEWVRSTEGWEKFVLPTALPSVVDQETQTPHSLLMQADKAGYSPGGEVEELDEEDEEDVVFVMGREAQAWSPERPR